MPESDGELRRLTASVTWMMSPFPKPPTGVKEGVRVGVIDGVRVIVAVVDGVRVFVAVPVLVAVPVFVAVLVMLGVAETVGVSDAVGVREGVAVFVGVATPIFVTYWDATHPDVPWIETGIQK